MALSKKVKMEVLNGLPAVVAGVDDDAVAVGQPLLFGNKFRGGEQVSE